MKWSFQVPCLACKRFHGVPDSPAEFHHAAGRTISGAHLLAFSLCARHHRIAGEGYVSRHGDGLAAFEARYMTEAEFIAMQMAEIEQLKTRVVG
jgi:hypothetical protein